VFVSSFGLELRLEKKDATFFLLRKVIYTILTALHTQGDNFAQAWVYCIVWLCFGSRTATISFLTSDLLPFPPDPDSSDCPLCPKGDKQATWYV